LGADSDWRSYWVRVRFNGLQKEVKIMKILLIGLLAFLSWSVLSAYIYVYKIKGLGNETNTIQVDTVSPFEMIAEGNTQKASEVMQTVMPDNLIIYFAFDKSEFSSDPKADKYFEISNVFLDQNPQVRLNITGYADAIGSDEYNHALGYRRAERMKQYFESKGMPENKIKIESRGEKDPADDNNTTAGRANNRRAIIAITK
jgi:outer membrane protein OmpA-like peptidoglycan-associated protein